tara:strand:- start:1492 stop:1596 length:105 start_codon:yes stop_codon:yes gene_type:complete
MTKKSKSLAGLLGASYKELLEMFLKAAKERLGLV